MAPATPSRSPSTSQLEAPPARGAPPPPRLRRASPGGRTTRSGPTRAATSEPRCLAIRRSRPAPRGRSADNSACRNRPARKSRGARARRRGQPACLGHRGIEAGVPVPHRVSMLAARKRSRSRQFCFGVSDPFSIPGARRLSIKTRGGGGAWPGGPCVSPSTMRRGSRRLPKAHRVSVVLRRLLRTTRAESGWRSASGTRTAAACLGSTSARKNWASLSGAPM